MEAQYIFEGSIHTTTYLLTDSTQSTTVFQWWLSLDFSILTKAETEPVFYYNTAEKTLLHEFEDNALKKCKTKLFKLGWDGIPVRQNRK